jgi:hypothetical protein
MKYHLGESMVEYYHKEQPQGMVKELKLAK